MDTLIKIAALAVLAAVVFCQACWVGGYFFAKGVERAGGLSSITINLGGAAETKPPPVAKEYRL